MVAPGHVMVRTTADIDEILAVFIFVPAGDKSSLIHKGYRAIHTRVAVFRQVADTGYHAFGGFA